MATGVLVLGVERATRLLTYLVGADKAYQATIRLGQATVTDDADGEIVARASAATVTEESVRAALRDFVGELDQVPSAVSAVKIDGVRAYKRVRAGEGVDLPARRVTISRLEVLAVRPVDGAEVLDVDVAVECSSGTYVRAIARDLGSVLGTGGHLTALRRTRVGDFIEAEAVTLDALADRADPVVIPLASAAARLLARRDADPEEARVLGHGGPIPARGMSGPYAVFAPSGHVIAVVSERDGQARPEVVLAPAGPPEVD